MAEPFAFLNGRFLPAAEMKIHVGDMGFVQGVTVAEQMRTFHGALFRLEQHLERLARSLEIIGVDPGMTNRQIAAMARRLASENRALLAEGDDLALTLFVTPGLYPNYDPEGKSGPTLGMHTTPLPFRLWVDHYTHGQKLVMPDIVQVPAACWPHELKCRSRMHYYLADRRARQVEPGARALLLDHEGRVTEASTANIVIYCREEGLVSPPKEMILPGVSMSVVEELAAELKIPFTCRELLPEDVAQADEALLTSTSPCIVPAVSLNGKPIGEGRPGEIFRRLLEAWNRRVGLDIVAQAKRFANRPTA
jgi:branched-subunit amino acid aminotransferase/4-amino-4-deoxychorismate lyase